jgi:hypothetical protein
LCLCNCECLVQGNYSGLVGLNRVNSGSVLTVELDV